MTGAASRGAVLTGAVLLLSGGLVGVATRGPIHAAVAVAAAAYVVVVITVGARTTGIVLMVAAFASAPMYRGIEDITGGVPPTDVFAIAGIVHLLPSVIGNRLRVPTVYLLGLLLISVCSLISVIVTGDFHTNAFHAGQWLFFLGALPLAIAWWRPHRTIVDRLLWGYLVGHLISTGKAVAEGAVFTDRYDGLTHHPNAFGLAGVTSIAMVLYLFHRYRGVRVRVVLAGFAVVGLVSITLSGSRASIVVLVALILLIPIVERSALMGMGLAVVGALGVLAIPLIVRISDEESAVGRLTGGGTAEGSDRVREDVFEAGLDRLWQSPILGSGFKGIEVIHNLYLEAAVAIGVFGLLGYLMVLFALARPLFSHHPQRRLSYIVWVFLGVAPTFPSLWDRTVWVPASLAVLAMLAPEKADAPVGPEVGPEAPGTQPAPVTPGRA